MSFGQACVFGFRLKPISSNNQAASQIVAHLKRETKLIISQIASSNFYQGLV